MPCHGQKARKEDVSVIEHLLAYLAQSSPSENTTFRPGICNRLDRNTTGLIVAGKTVQGLQVMNRLFKERDLKKYYLCLVKGRVEKKSRIDGYLLKTSDSVELLRAVHYVCDGKRFIQPSLIPLLNAKLMARDMEADKFNKLSDREKDVIRYVALGLLNKEIGEKMGISERTVKNHLSNIFKKIDCSDRTQAAIFAIRNGLVKIH